MKYRNGSAYPETPAELRQEIERIDRHLLTIPAECEVAGIYKKLRDDLSGFLLEMEAL